MSTKAKKSTATKTPKGELVTREVELDLTDDVKVRLFDELADKEKAKTKLEADFSEVKQKWSDRIKPVKDRIAAIMSYVENGKERKTVKCTAVKNFQENRVEYWFEDKIVDTREMTALDRQEKLPIKKGRTNSVEKPAKKDARMAAAGDKSLEDDEIDQVRREETGRKTKRSAVDGPTPSVNGSAT